MPPCLYLPLRQSLESPLGVGVEMFFDSFRYSLASLSALFLTFFCFFFGRFACASSRIIRPQILEVILPIGFVAILIAIKSSTEDTTSEIEPAFLPTNREAFQPLTFQDYVSAMQATRLCEEQEFSYEDFETGEERTARFLGITGMERAAYNWQVPTVKCDHRKCEDDGEDASTFCEYSILAVTGMNEGGMARASEFRDWLYATYPALALPANETSLKFPHEFCQVMDSVDTLKDYVKSSDYGKDGFPKVAMAVVWDGNDPSRYAYKLRHNATNYNNPADEERPGARTTPPTDQFFESFAKSDLECPEDDRYVVLLATCACARPHDFILTHSHVSLV
jgi:hypothetical protein